MHICEYNVCTYIAHATSNSIFTTTTSMHIYVHLHSTCAYTHRYIQTYWKKLCSRFASHDIPICIYLYILIFIYITYMHICVCIYMCHIRSKFISWCWANIHETWAIASLVLLYTCICTYEHIYTYVCMYTCTYTYVYPNICMCIYIYLKICIYIYICIYIPTYIYIYIHEICIYIYTCIYVHKCI